VRQILEGVLALAILAGAYLIASQLPTLFLLGVIVGALLYGLADWIDPGCLRRMGDRHD
jgi:hypothetical protein